MRQNEHPTPGVMTIEGNYDQTSSGTLVINLLNASTYSQLLVTDKASLAGDLEVALTPGFSISSTDTFRILQASGGVSGTFDDLINFNLPASFDPNLLYFPDYVLLVFNPALLDNFIGNFHEVIFSSVTQRNVLLDREMGRLRDRFTCGCCQSNPCSNNDCAEKNCCGSPWNFYMGPTGTIGDVKSLGNQVGFNYASIGALAGLDYAFSNFGIGVLTQYERITADVNLNWGDFHVDNIHASLYGTYAPTAMPELALNAIVGGGYGIYDINRKLNNLTGQQRAKGTPHGGEFDALLGLEYNLGNCEWQIVPLAAVQYIYLDIDRYQERDSGQYIFNRRDLDSCRSILGLRANYTWVDSCAVFTPEINLGWQREFLDKRKTYGFNPIGFSDISFTTDSAAAGRNIGIAGIDLQVCLYDCFSIEASYNFEYNSLYQDHFLYLGFNASF